MAPEVVFRKLEMLRRLLADLEPFADADHERIVENHYVVERVLELLGTAAADLVSHLLRERGQAPSSYRESFRRAGEQGLIPSSLAASLEEAAAMRNVLVHMYEDIDYEILHSAVPRALRDFRQLVAELESHAQDRE